jgi:hypothetical protein
MAQQANGEGPVTPSAQQPEAAAETGTADETSTADTNKQPAQATRSPSDYRASEQISEDLPVSFPVDI